MLHSRVRGETVELVEVERLTDMHGGHSYLPTDTIGSPVLRRDTTGTTASKRKA